MTITPLFSAAILVALLNSLFCKTAQAAEPTPQEGHRTLASPDLKATIYPVKGETKKPLFLFERHHLKEENSDIYNMSFRDVASNEPVAFEEMKFENGVFARYKLDHTQTGETSIVTHKKGKLTLRHKKKKNDKWDKVTYDYNSSFLVPSQILDFAISNLNQLRQKKAVKVKLAVPNFVNFFSFKYQTTSIDEAKQIAEVEFVPRNIFISMFAGKVEMKIDLNRQRVLEVKGPTLLYCKDAQLLARTVFDYSHKSVKNEEQAQQK